MSKKGGIVLRALDSPAPQIMPPSSPDRRLPLALLLILLGLAACSGDVATDPDPDPDPEPDPPVATGPLRLVPVVSGLSQPVALVSPPGDSRLFIVEQGGRIRVLKDGALVATPFLDVRGRIVAGGEQGLLGLAFHPQYAQNRQLYINYTATGGATRIVRYTARSDNPDLVDPASESILLTVEQPFSNHNGGQLAFGPDGMLWIGMGDGGSGGDPRNDAQNRSTLLGAMLRIDVDRGSPYGIPANNPFASGGGRPEIWAIGLRNPWRWSFDRVAGLVYIADVGQDRWEEVNVAPLTAAGVNYGWRTMEGPECFNPSSGCNQAGLHLPVLSYRHEEGCSITGGVVYRGRAIPSLVGHYLYSDFCRGWIRSFRLQGNVAMDRQERLTGVGNVVSFGEDRNGEVYVLTSDGQIRRLAPGS